ncbi:uncharacterized protein CCR75_001524 [Bremia lactucae]|uniref:Uncharacterized protein n=1 Tax=Bremia lactucae TaxID=4779 RepID=A0A976FEC4_BRELC|nr:hypothetical protein CCR75_001524 [Bremia lactucae]
MPRKKFKSLVELSIVTVARYTPVQDVLKYVEYLPTAIRYQLFNELSNVRLREMEVALELAAQHEPPELCDGYDPQAGDKFLFDQETQSIWRSRIDAARLGYEYPLMKKTVGTQGCRRNSRHVFWEHQFRTMLRAHTSKVIAGNAAAPPKHQRLFENVVEILKVHGREICQENCKLILSLGRLQRLEVHHPEQQNMCWKTMRQLIHEHLYLRELGFFHGKINDYQMGQIRDTLMRSNFALSPKLTCHGITTLELVSVKIRHEGFCQLVSLVANMSQLLQLRLSNVITDFETKLLIDAAFCAPRLERLFLEHNELEDDAFIGLSTLQAPLPLRHLRLRDNNLSFNTVEAICNASLNKVLNLAHLEFTNNVQIGNLGINALTPVLTSPALQATTALTHLDVRDCNFGLDGAINLLIALGQNRTVTHLNIAQNCFGTGFDDVLAAFLLTNKSVSHLQTNGVGLGQNGVSARLLTALETNSTLVSLSMGANRLRNDGAAAIFRSVVKRARIKPMILVDLSGNLLTLSGLVLIAEILEAAAVANAPYCGSNEQVDALRHRKRRRTNDLVSQTSPRSCSTGNKFIEELWLLNNEFLESDEIKSNSSSLIASIRNCVGHLRSNEWASFPQVYDDEV